MTGDQEIKLIDTINVHVAQYIHSYQNNRNSLELLLKTFRIC